MEEAQFLQASVSESGSLALAEGGGTGTSRGEWFDKRVEFISHGCTVGSIAHAQTKMRDGVSTNASFQILYVLKFST